MTLLEPLAVLRFRVMMAFPFTTMSLLLKVYVTFESEVTDALVALSTCTARVPPSRVMVLLPRVLLVILPPPDVASALASKVPACNTMPPVKVLLAVTGVVAVRVFVPAVTPVPVVTVIVVGLVIPVITSPAGRPVPVINWPTMRPAVESTVTMLLPAVVTAVASEMLGIPRFSVLPPALTKVPAPLTTPESVTLEPLPIWNTALPTGPRLTTPLIWKVPAVPLKLMTWPCSPGDPPKVRLPLAAPRLPALGTPRLTPFWLLLLTFTSAVPWLTTMLLEYAT